MSSFSRVSIQAVLKGSGFSVQRGSSSNAGERSWTDCDVLSVRMTRFTTMIFSSDSMGSVALKRLTQWTAPASSLDCLSGKRFRCALPSLSSSFFLRLPKVLFNSSSVSTSHPAFCRSSTHADCFLCFENWRSVIPKFPDNATVDVEHQSQECV